MLMPFHETGFFLKKTGLVWAHAFLLKNFGILTQIGRNLVVILECNPQRFYYLILLGNLKTSDTQQCLKIFFLFFRYGIEDRAGIALA